MAVDIVSNQNEKEELYRGIWALANDMRGSVDGWDFKPYVLGTMFYRYISEEICEYINNNENHDRADGFDYATLSDEAAEQGKANIIQEKVFFILPSELFCNVAKRAKSDLNLNETLERIFNHIEDSAKGGEYFAPADISELLTRLATVSKTEVNKVYEMYLQGNDTKFGGCCLKELRK